jgi:hypothetical protein
MEIPDTVVEGHEGITEGSHEFLVYEKVLLAQARAHGLHPVSAQRRCAAVVVCAWCVVCGVWSVVCDGVWCVVCGVRCVVYGVWCVVCGV